MKKDKIPKIKRREKRFTTIYHVPRPRFREFRGNYEFDQCFKQGPYWLCCVKNKESKKSKEGQSTGNAVAPQLETQEGSNVPKENDLGDLTSKESQDKSRWDIKQDVGKIAEAVSQISNQVQKNAQRIEELSKGTQKQEGKESGSMELFGKTVQTNKKLKGSEGPIVAEVQDISKGGHPFKDNGTGIWLETDVGKVFVGTLGSSRVSYQSKFARIVQVYLQDGANPMDLVGEKVVLRKGKKKGGGEYLTPML